MRIVRLSWEEIEKACRIVSTKILVDHFKPDLCVAISRGGFPPARIVCDFLDISNLTSIRIEYYSSVNETIPEPKLVYPLNADVKGTKVLVIDDVADRGDSLILAKKHVQEMGASEAKLATLHYKPWSKIKPDYYAFEYKSWIVYPWEIIETARKISSKLLQQGKRLNEIRRDLLRIKLTQAEIRQALSEPL
nr:phosphoribosyltransferase [Candidatus Njordarchaeota archaeon]